MSVCRLRDAALQMHNFELYDTTGRLINNTNHEARENFVVHRFTRPDDSVIEPRGVGVAKGGGICTLFFNPL